MGDLDKCSKSGAIKGLLRMAGPIAAATLILGMVIVLPRSATAKPEFAVKTGLQCGQCHVNSGGGGKLKPFGEAFEANGFKLPKKKK